MTAIVNKQTNRLGSLIAVLFMVLAMSANSVKAQVDCPPYDPMCQWSNWITETFTTNDVPCNVQYQYRTRICNGNIDVQYNIITATGDCDWMESHNELEAKISSMREMLEIVIMRRVALTASGGLTNLPPCPNGNTVINYYTAACGIWLSCTYDVTAHNMSCETGFDPMPNPNPSTIDVWQWFDCGTACCTRTYNVCFGTTDGSAYGFQRVGNPTMLGQCSDQNQFAKPCNSYCYQF
jgi:hypothetical protein